LKLNKLIIFFLFSFVFAYSNAISQNEKDSVSRIFFYFEALGMGGYASLNYENLFYRKEKFSTTFRIGLSTYHIKDYTNRFNPDIIVPFSISALYGNTHKIECGFGQTLSSIIVAAKPNFQKQRTTTLNTVFCFGYRYCRSPQGIVLRITYYPIIQKNTIKHHAGISIGYTF